MTSTPQERIAKLLRIAQDPSATKGERTAAQKQAEKLMAKHKVQTTTNVDGTKEPAPQLDQTVTRFIDAVWGVTKFGKKKRR